MALQTDSLLSPSRLLSPIVLKRSARRKRPVPIVLPWGRSVHGMAVGEFLEDYQAHLPQLMASMRSRGAAYGPEAEQRVRRLIAVFRSDDQSDQSLMFAVMMEILRQRRLEAARAAKKQSARREAAQERKRQTLQNAEEKQEKEKDESDNSDPVAAAVDYLLSLIGL